MHTLIVISFLAFFFYLGRRSNPTRTRTRTITIISPDPDTQNALNIATRYKDFVRRTKIHLRRPIFRNKKDIVIYTVANFETFIETSVHTSNGQRNGVTEWGLAASALLAQRATKDSIKTQAQLGNSLLNRFADQMVDNCRAKSNDSLVSILIPHLRGFRNDKTLGDYCEAALHMASDQDRIFWMTQYFSAGGHTVRPSHAHQFHGGNI